MKYRKRNPYKPLRFAQGVVRAIAACPRWRMVTAVLPTAWLERDHTGAGRWHEGAPPMQAGVVCDETWRPVPITTLSGRPLPVLAEEWEEDES